jgi:transposase InsO family protein
VPEKRWQDISIDFIKKLPRSRGFDGLSYINIIVVVDRLSKQAHYIPCRSITAQVVADLFYREIFKHHSLPRSIISDRGTQFVSYFWLALYRRMGVKAALSTAYHPETDGQTKRINARMETYLKTYMSYL